MPTKPTKRLISEKDAAIPSLISKTLMKGPVVEDEDCPWVKIGNLYVSVTITGNNSWLPLIARLVSDGQSRFIVFTGRHGDIPNLVNSSGQMIGVFDFEHFEQDAKVQVKALHEFPNIELSLVDTGAHGFFQTEWLRAVSSVYLKSGKAVIYAWCYGLFSMVEGVSGAEKFMLEKRQNYVINKSIGQLVKEYWNWVPRTA